MSWDIVLEIIGSFGGAAAIIVAAVKFTSNIIADRLKQKYELDMSKELEKYKTMLGNKTFISKTRFETEFKIYKDLSSTFFEASKAISILIPYGYCKEIINKEDRDKQETKNYKVARSAVVKAQDSLNSNAPFIPKKFF